MSEPENRPALSVLIPAYNEELVIGQCVQTVIRVLESAKLSFEVLIVDDGSSDSTPSILADIVRTDSRVRVLRLSRNFGHQCAVTAGLAGSSGSAVAILDADLQDPPEVIPEMLKLLEQGYGVVYGVRRKRKEGFLKKTTYWFYYRLLRALSELPPPLDSGDFCVLSRRVVDCINLMPERTRYIRGLRNWVGFRQTAFPYERAARAAGKERYTLKKLLNLAESGLLSNSRIPLKLSAYLGFFVAGLGFAWAVKVLVFKLAYNTAPQGFTALMIALLVVGGTQLIGIGVVGHYLGRILDQTERRPHFVIEKTYNLPDEARKSIDSTCFS